MEIESMLNEISIMCFLSVAKHRSFTKASEEVFMSRQAVSKKILSLEERLGVKLFDRTTTGIELTVEGKLYLEFFEKTSLEFGSLFETIGKPRTSTMQLTIGYEIGIIIDKRVIEIMGVYKNQRENIDSVIKRHEPQVIESKLLNGQIDIAFTTIPTHCKLYNDKGFSYIILEQAEFVLVTSTNHPKVNEKTVLADFNGEKATYWNWNVDGSDDIISRKSFVSAWADIDITVIPAVQCLSLSSAYTEVLLGNAVMLCNAKNELCTFPGIITYPLSKKEIFGCAWNINASPEIKEFAETFRKYEISTV